MLLADAHRGTVASDRNYDMRRCVRWLRGQGFTPHVAAERPFSAIDRRTTRHPGYAVSQQKRKLVEQVFGWMKTGARGARSGTVAAIASIGPSLRRGRLQPNPGTHLSW